jgi:hypothetical protein
MARIDVALVITAMNICVQQNIGEFFSSWATDGFALEGPLTPCKQLIQHSIATRDPNSSPLETFHRRECPNGDTNRRCKYTCRAATRQTSKLQNRFIEFHS